MKNTLAFLTLMCALCGGALAQNAEQLIVTGRILEEGKRSEGATVTVYNGNDIYRTFETSKNGKYGINLPLGFYFTLEVTKGDFVTKRLVFDTRTEKDIRHLDNFVCDVDLIAASWFGNQDIGVLDFPMAFITYQGQGQFDFETEYATAMVGEYELLITQAMNSSTTRIARR